MSSMPMPRSHLQAGQQVENLRLNGHVERGRRLVGDQEFRLAGQGDGDHHPLLHAAGKLEGVFAQAALADRRCRPGGSKSTSAAVALAPSAGPDGARAPRRSAGRR